jgi:predicted DsbA family dithiol-disulfide isomerase
MSTPDSPKSALELRAEELGIRFTRGRTWTSNSHLSLQAAEFADGRPERDAFHRRVFKAYFEELADIGSIDTLVKLGEESGLPGNELRAVLEQGTLRRTVDDGLNWSRAVGVTAVPTFIFDESTGVVGAQPVEVLDQVMQELGKKPRAAV